MIGDLSHLHLGNLVQLNRGMQLFKKIIKDYKGL